MAVPLRMCAVGREMKPKTDLIRLVKVDGKIVVDTKQKMQGRGLWICKDMECLSKLKKSKCLNKAFKCEILDSVYDEILGSINGQK